MLISLHIENLAVIKCIDIDFFDGFMAMTGETGAGKSIIIDSINLLLGAKADKELIRTGESSAMVSGVFRNLSEATYDILRENGVSDDGEGNILIQRTVSADGRSSIKINGRTVTLTVLRDVASALVSIHGQSDTAALSDENYQLNLIDMYAGTEALISEYKEHFSRFEKIRQEKRELMAKEHERERLSEILSYQINDIDSYSLHDGEEEELVERKMKIKSSERILKNAGFAFKALKGSEKGSVSFLLDKSATALEQISDVVGEFSEYSEKMREILYQVEDIAEEVYAQISDMDDNPDDALNEIESRLDKISKLKRKYGLTVKDVLEFRERAAEELQALENSDELIKKLEKEELSAYDESLKIAEQIHAKRILAAGKIETEVKKTLEFLDMPKVVFFISVTEELEEGKKRLSPTGYDTVTFFISANRGVDPQPLSKVASGGEMARVMLALKSVIADKDGTKTIVFDEIDAGVSGKTARKIGIKMQSLSKNTQILAVTHSAQIASVADVHYLISKSDVNGATETAVNLLDRDGRIAELSRILGGIAVTEAQKKAAIDMLDEKSDYN